MMAAMAYIEDRPTDFEAEVNRALDINPAYGDIYRVAGSHTARAYRFDEAVELVERALELDPNNTRASAELGMHLLRTGDEPAAAWRSNGRSKTTPSTSAPSTSST